MTARRWWPPAAATVPAAAGAGVGVLAWLVWTGLDAFASRCDSEFCRSTLTAPGWKLGPVLLGLVGWGLVAWGRLISGSGVRGGRSAVIAAVGAGAGYLGIWLLDAFRYGTPRPPFAAFVLFGMGGYLLGAAMVDGGRRLRIGAATLAGILLAATLTAQLTSPGRDRLHRFTIMRDVLLLPDHSRYRIVSAEAYPRHDAVLLKLAPGGGGPTLELFELPIPTTWNPPAACGPSAVSLAAVVWREGTVHDEECTTSPVGGWQRVYPSGKAELLDVHGATLAVVTPVGPTATVPATELHDVLTSLRTATPAQLAELPVG